MNDNLTIALIKQLEELTTAIQESNRVSEEKNKLFRDEITFDEDHGNFEELENFEIEGQSN